MHIRNTTVAILLSLAALPANSDAQLTQYGDRYVYCNVYLGTSCFGIAQGDNLSMQIPFDFVLYGIEFGFGGSALIYSGFNPQSVNPEAVHLSSDCGRKSDSCNLYKVSPGRYRLLFEVDGKFLDINISGVSNENLGQLNNFLHNFRYCNASRSNVVCTEERIFRKIKINAPIE